MRTVTTLAGIFLLSFGGAAWTGAAAAAGEESGGWRAPEEARKVVNPVKPSPESIASGKGLFEKNCAKCHGLQGHGDGKMAKILTTKPADLTKRLSMQTDGEIFWKASEGKNPMPAFKKDLKPEERWNVVNFVRHVILAPKPAGADSARSGSGGGSAGSTSR